TNRKDDATPSDQVIVIDPLNDKITKRISLSPENHLAHVVISPDNKKAYLTAQEKGLVYIINTANFAVEKTINLGAQSGPHGLRITPDGAQVFIALLDGKAVAMLDTTTDEVEEYPFESGAVQTAVTPDDRFAFVSLYTTKQIARLERASGKIEKIGLPKEAKGPVQLYPTPDSRFVYVADQGYYFNQPTGDKVYRISVENGTVDQTISAGSAPHGVVVDSAGKFVYITNLLSDDVSIIDVATGKEIARIPVGDMPNGISIWHRANGGTP
ncbi:MAG: YncE family protein, partial [Patescibacteria group bacterium]